MVTLVLEAAVLTISFLEIFIGGLNVEGEADSWDFGVGK